MRRLFAEGDGPLETDMPPIPGVSTATTAFVGRTREGAVNAPGLVNSFAEFERSYGGLWTESPMTFAVRHFFENGGAQAVIVRVVAGALTGSASETADTGGPISNRDILGSKGDKTGLYALLDCDIFNLLCLPPPAPNVATDTATWTEAAEFCQQQRAMLIVDAPPDAPSVVRNTGPACVSNTEWRKNAALFYPRVRATNPLSPTNAVEEFVPCGAVAGLFARTDGTRGVWKAPAGIDSRLSVSGLSASLTDVQNSDLNSRGINCLRTLPGSGTVSWGARTMDGADSAASEWKYIPVRRTALYIEESVKRGLVWSVVEPNAEPLWARVRLDVGAFMQGLFRQGAFAGTTPREAYFVKVDADTTRQADIESGVMNVLIGFAPLKRSEFVTLTVRKKTAPA